MIGRYGSQILTMLVLEGVVLVTQPHKRLVLANTGVCRIGIHRIHNEDQFPYAVTSERVGRQSVVVYKFTMMFGRNLAYRIAIYIFHMIGSPVMAFPYKGRALTDMRR